MADDKKLTEKELKRKDCFEKIGSELISEKVCIAPILTNVLLQFLRNRNKLWNKEVAGYDMAF